MTRKSFVLILTVCLLSMGQIVPTEKKSKYTIEYPYEVSLRCDAYGNSTSEIIITTNSPEDILINRIKTSSENYCLEYDDVKVDGEEELRVAKDKPLSLDVYLMNDELERTPSILEFSTSNPDYQKNGISLQANTVEILSEDMRNGKVELEISNFNVDSVLLRFPYGGTISSATIWRSEDLSKQTVIATLDGYEIGSENNYIVWAKDDIGEFSANFGSCHWYADFELVLK